MEVIFLAQDDQDFELSLSIEFRPGMETLNLEGASALFKAQHTSESSLAWSITSSTVNIEERTAVFDMADNLVGARLGDYYAELQISWNDSIVTTARFTVKVVPDLPLS